MAENGSVAWVFESKGLISVEKSAADEDELFMIAVEAGAEEVDSENDVFDITTPLTDLDRVKKALTEAGIEMTGSEPTRIPSNSVRVQGKEAGQVIRLIEVLEDNDDVQKVYSNFDMDEEEMAALMAE